MSLYVFVLALPSRCTEAIHTKQKYAYMRPSQLKHRTEKKKGIKKVGVFAAMWVRKFSQPKGEVTKRYSSSYMKTWQS